MSTYTQDEKGYLLNLARTTIQNSINNQQTKAELTNPKFTETLSCFVTLHSANGDLRGCIGSVS